MLEANQARNRHQDPQIPLGFHFQLSRRSGSVQDEFEHDQLVPELVQGHHRVKEAKIKNPKTMVLLNFAELPLYKISAQSDDAIAVFRPATDARTHGRTRIWWFQHFISRTKTDTKKPMIPTPTKSILARILKKKLAL